MQLSAPFLVVSASSFNIVLGRAGAADAGDAV